VFAILTLLVIVALSSLVGRVATVALTVTGMPREVARFQARSALTGAGFTTSESEQIVNHPVRRRIVMQLMLVGSLNVVLTAGTLITGFVGPQGLRQTAVRLAVLVAGLFALVWASRSPWVDRRLAGLISRLVRRVTEVDLRDYAGMLRLAGDYAIGELAVEAGDWLAGRTLTQADLPQEGILVLGIVRHDGEYIGAPTGATELHAGDMLILYGRVPVFQELDERRAGTEGDRAHLQAVAENRRVVDDERRRDHDAA
jgi:hypothetical protein